MPFYKYVAQNSDGKEIKGKLKANNTAEVAAYLTQKLLIPISIDETSGDSVTSLKDFATLEISFQKGISDEELLGFSRNMSTMLQAGIPILRALEQLALYAESDKFKKILLSVLDEVRVGKTLSDAMKQYPDAFTSIYIHAVEIGENSGNLENVFSKLSEFLEMEDKNKKRLNAAIRYPKMVIIAMTIAIIIINVFVVPAFVSMFRSFKAELPTPTKILIATSDFMTNNWFLMVLFMLAIYAGIKVMMKNKEVKFAWDRFKFKLPVLGPLIQKIMLTRFVWALSLMIKSGVSLTTAIELVSKSSGNLYLEKKISEIQEKVETSKTLAEAIDESNLFDPVSMQMMYIGDESGNLDEMLEYISAQFDRQTQYALKKFSDFIEPALLLILGVMVALLALAVFLPMWDLGRAALKN